MELPLDEFVEYILDICSQPDVDQGAKLRVVLERFAGASIRAAASQLLNKDIVIQNMTDAELADALQRHVTFRSAGGTEAKLPNGAWSMMLEAAGRLLKGAVQP